jgi:predicted SnoaL-like aldol condensation-catalyzing enzyme
MSADIQQNKATVTAFYDTAFNQKRPDEAVSLYVGHMYKQHNPNFGDGPQAFIDAVKAWIEACPSLRTDIKRIIAEGDLVVTHVYIKQHEKDLGTAAIDIFRLENGKIVEHWDVTTAIPEKSANGNTMF